MSKRTFAARTFKARSFGSRTWAGGVKRPGCWEVDDFVLFKWTISDQSCGCCEGGINVGYNVHDLGSLVRVAGGLTDEVLLTAKDADVVKVSVLKPSGTTQTYVYGTDSNVIRDATGQYYADINVDTAGMWAYRWWSTGDGQGAEEHRFKVRAAQAV